MATKVKSAFTRPATPRTTWLTAMAQPGPAPAGSGFLWARMALRHGAAYADRLCPGAVVVAADLHGFAANYARPPHPDLLDVIEQRMVADLDLYLFVDLVGHRDLRAHAGLEFRPVTGGDYRPLIENRLRDHARSGLLDADALRDMIRAAASTQLRTALLAAYRAARHDLADLIGGGNPTSVSDAATAALLSGGATLYAPTVAALLDRLSTSTTALNRSRYTAGDVDALLALNTREGLPLLRTLLEEPSDLPVTAAQARALLALKDKPARNRLGNLTQLAGAAEDGPLNAALARGCTITDKAASELLYRHGHRLHGAALTAVLDRAQEGPALAFISAEPSARALPAVLASVHGGPDTVVRWINGHGDVTAEQAPLAFALLLHNLEALSFELDHGTAGGGTDQRMLAHQARQHVSAQLRAVCGTSPALWLAAEQLIRDRCCTSLDELLAVLASLAAAPAA